MTSSSERRKRGIAFGRTRRTVRLSNALTNRKPPRTPAPSPAPRRAGRKTSKRRFNGKTVSEIRKLMNRNISGYQSFLNTLSAEEADKLMAKLFD